MKLLLLKILLQRRGKDEGFTLPMVIALGLVMVLLGTANIVKSSEENLNAITQNSSSDALAIAEVGVTKYRELLNQNRILTIYNHNQWDDADTDAVGDIFDNVSAQACTDMTAAPPGWTGTATKPNDNAYNAVDDDDNWWNVSEDIDGDGNAETIGKYRLVSYEYDIDGSIGDADDNGIPDDTNDNGRFSVLADVNADYPTDTSNDNDTDDDGESDAVGILTVQGQSTDGSEAQIRVEIPLRINQNDMASLAPAIWIGTEDPTYLSSLNANLDTLTISSDSNIVIFDAANSAVAATGSTPAIPASNGCSDPADNGANSVISDARNIPSITPIANKIAEASAASRVNTSLPTSPLKLGNTTAKAFVTPPAGVTFDEDVHCKNISDCRYYYNLGATDIDVETKTDGIAKVTLYVDGNLNINRDIGSDISSSYLEIYVTSSGSITIDSNNVNTINALIHAPDSQLTINGSGNVTINGAVWVDKFVNNATATINPDQTKISSRSSVPSYELYTSTSNRIPRPLTSSPTNWVREEVE